MMLKAESHRSRALGAILASLLAACTSPAPENSRPSPDADAWPRCYSLRLGEWTAPPGQKVTVTHTPPAVVQLDTLLLRATSERVMRVLTPGVPALSAGGRVMAPFWARLPSDSLELTWSTGYEAVTVTVAERGDSISGTALTSTDYGARSFAPVTGRRTPCVSQGSKE